MKSPLSAMVLAAAAAWAGLAALAVAAGDADHAFRQAKQAFDRGDYEAATAQCDEAIRLAPKEAKLWGLRGAARLRKGDYAGGLADLKAAIRLNPGDAGRRYRPSSAAKLSAEAIQHGRRQVARMLRDRPAMAQFVEETEFLRRWAAGKFAGEDFGAPIDWDPTPPLHSDAEHFAPGDGENAAILIEALHTDGPNRGRRRSFEELWAGAVYELHNVNYAREFVRLSDEADEGKLSKEAFVAGILKYELRAAQQTRAFYVEVFLPWAEKKKLPTDPMLWFCGWWDTPEEALKSFSDKSAYPWHPYARQHDWATVHRHWHLGKFKKAQELLERMRTEKGYENEQSDVSYWIGRCLVRLERPAEAVAAFSEAIRLDPENADAYRARGEVYERLGEKTKAQADLARAKKLEDEE